MDLVVSSSTATLLIKRLLIERGGPTVTVNNFKKKKNHGPCTSWPSIFAKKSLHGTKFSYMLKLWMFCCLYHLNLRALTRALHIFICLYLSNFSSCYFELQLDFELYFPKQKIFPKYDCRNFELDGSRGLHRLLFT